MVLGKVGRGLQGHGAPFLYLDGVCGHQGPPAAVTCPQVLVH